VDLWNESWDSFVQSPIVGKGYATFQYGQHTDDLKDTHNLYVKYLVETGIIGLVMVMILLQQMFSLGYRLFRGGSDPLYRGLGLGLILATTCAVVTNFLGQWNFIKSLAPWWVLLGAGARQCISRAGYADRKSRGLAPTEAAVKRRCLLGRAVPQGDICCQ